jgi:hypothetical protein
MMVAFGRLADLYCLPPKVRLQSFVPRGLAGVGFQR